MLKCYLFLFCLSICEDKIDLYLNVGDPEGTYLQLIGNKLSLEKRFPSRFGARVEYVRLHVMIWKEPCNVRLFKRKCLCGAFRNISCVSTGLLKIND